MAQTNGSTSERKHKKTDGRVATMANLSTSERDLIKQVGLKLERKHTKRGYSKAEAQVLDLAHDVSMGELDTNLMTKGLRVSLRQIAKRLVSNIIEPVVRSEKQAKPNYLPLYQASDKYHITEAEAYQMGIRPLAQDSKPKRDKIKLSQFRLMVDETITELEALPMELRVYLASAYVLSCKTNRKIWSDKEDCFMDIITSLLEVAHKVGTLAEAQAYCIAKRRLVDYWRIVYKHSQETSLDYSLSDDSILNLPEADFEQVIYKRGNKHTEELDLNKSAKWNMTQAATLIILKAERDSKLENHKLRSERQASRTVLKDTMEYSRLIEAEADLKITLKGIKDKRFKRIFVQVKDSGTTKLSEVLTTADYEYMHRYLKAHPIDANTIKQDLEAFVAV